MKHIIKKISIFVMLFVTTFMLSACGGSKRLVVVTGPNPDTIDPALNSAVDGATMIIHAFSGLVRFDQNEDGGLVLVPDVIKEIPKPTKLTGGKVQYVFTLKDDLKWSDGSPLTAHDFEYAWKRAASADLGADYGYMFDVIDGYYNSEGDQELDKEKLNVKASSDGKQLTVVLSTDVPYFIELCAFPAYMPVKKEIVVAALEKDPETNEMIDTGKWAVEVDTYIGNGPFKMVEWVADSKIVFEKNEYYHDADKVKLKEIEFALSDNDSAILAGYKNGTYKFIDALPNKEIAKLKEDYPNEFVVAGQLGTYYVTFNVDDDLLYENVASTEEEKVKVRKALGLLIDRNHIAVNIGQAGQQPANAFVPTGLTEPDGKTEFVKKNGPTGKGEGYFSVNSADYTKNIQDAIKLLKDVGYTYNETTKKFTDFPSFEYIFNPNTLHQAIAEYLQALYASYGIEMSPVSVEWKVFLNQRKEGDFTAARNGWLGDYNDPITFLDMWTSTSGNNDAQLGKGSHKDVAIYGPNNNQTWAQTYDVYINTVKSSSDPAVRFENMHKAETLLMSTGAICPIFFYTDLYMIKPELQGFYASPLGFKYFMFAELK